MKITIETVNGKQEIEVEHLLSVKFTIEENEIISVYPAADYLEVAMSGAISVEPRTANLVYIKRAK